MKKILEQIGLFEGVPSQNLEQVEKYFSPARKCATGEILMNPGEGAHDVFFLLEGRVRLSLYSSEGEFLSFREIEPYDYFGWLSVLDGQPRLTGASALGEAIVARVPASKFVELLNIHPAIQKNFLKRVGSVVRRYTERVQDLTFLSARQRIERELLRRFREKAGVLYVESHEDFATWTGTTRETVTRTLRLLEEEGFIRKTGSSYELLRADLPENTWFGE